MTWLPGFSLALALAAGDPAVESARAELSAVAVRIEQLKVLRLHGHAVGRELERLLVRAQELAVEIDRRSSEPAPAPDAAPSAEELRERADALRDEADRLAGVLTDVDVRIAKLRRPAAPSGRNVAAVTPMHHATATPTGSGGAPSLEDEQLRQLVGQRQLLAARLAGVRAEIAEVEAEAAAAER
jgi:hypothetical protein